MTVAFAIQTHFVSDEVIALASAACAVSPAVDLAIDAEVTAGERARLDDALLPGTIRRSRAVTWCGPSQVLALLDAIRVLVARPGWDRLVTLSGDSIPLRPLAELPGVLAAHYADDRILRLDSWRLQKPPILVERTSADPPRLLRNRYRDLFAVTPDLQPLFESADTPVRHASTRFFVACRERAGPAKRLRLSAFDAAELARRRAIWDRIEPRCARAYYVLTRAQCVALLDAVAGAQRELVDLFLTSFEPDEAWLATLAGEIGWRVELPAADAVVHHAGGKRVAFDAEQLAAMNGSGAFFARRHRGGQRRSERMGG